MLSQYKEIKTYCARTAEEAVQVAPHFKTHAVLMNYTLPDMPACDCIKQIKLMVPQAAFIVLMDKKSPRTVHELMRYGCTGFISTHTTADELYKAITTTLSGKLYFGADMENDIAVHAIKKLKKAATPPPFEITNKEKATLKDICDGLTNKEIGHKHHITEKAAEKRLHNLFVKTKTKNRQQLIVYTLRNDIIVDMEI
jgi:DNA-binding NarL/FixJ family response regulator